MCGMESEWKQETLQQRAPELHLFSRKKRQRDMEGTHYMPLLDMVCTYQGYHRDKLSASNKALQVDQNVPYMLME